MTTFSRIDLQLQSTGHKLVKMLWERVKKKNCLFDIHMYVFNYALRYVSIEDLDDHFFNPYHDKKYLIFFYVMSLNILEDTFLQYMLVIYKFVSNGHV